MNRKLTEQSWLLHPAVAGLKGYSHTEDRNDGL